jgi:hypothetical protein
MTAAPHRKSRRPPKERHISACSVRSDPPDLQAFAKALVDMALRDLDKEAGRAAAVPPPPGKKYY